MPALKPVWLGCFLLASFGCSRPQLGQPCEDYCQKHQICETIAGKRTCWKKVVSCVKYEGGKVCAKRCDANYDCPKPLRCRRVEYAGGVLTGQRSKYCLR